MKNQILNLQLSRLILILIIFFSYCCRGQNILSQPNSDLKIIINSSEINLKNNFNLSEKEKVRLTFEIQNSSDKNYAVVVDTTRLFKYIDYDFDYYSKITETNFDRQLFQFGFKIKQNRRIIDTGFSVASDYFDRLPTLEKTVNDYLLFIPKKSSIQFTKSFTLPIISDPKDESEIIFLGDSIKNMVFSVFLFQDKSLIKKYLNDVNREKLKRLNSDIYTGIIESNAVPITLN